MSAHRPRLAGLVSAGAIAVLATGCGAAKTSSSNPTPTGFGQLAIRVVDTPPDKPSGVAEIWVSITKVTAHASPGGWTTVVTKDPALPVNILALQASALDLGFANLPKGTVDQVRLYVSPADGANYVVLQGDPTPVPLKVPSGVQSGIKVHGPWQIDECTQTAVTLDFDGKNSIWYHPTGQGDLWILRPVIRVKKSESVPVGCVPGGSGSNGPKSCPPEECSAGELCVAGTCAGGADAPCSVDKQCFSGVCVAGERCAPGGFDTPCLGDADCTNGVCSSSSSSSSERMCGKGGMNAPCGADKDCLSDDCRDDSSCAAPAGVVPEGKACGADGECISGSCLIPEGMSVGVCGPSIQGFPCGETQSCATSLTCNSLGLCAP